MFKEVDHKTYKWSSQIDYEREPQLYEIGRGQQGVLVCEPYKSDTVQTQAI